MPMSRPRTALVAMAGLAPLVSSAQDLRRRERSERLVMIFAVLCVMIVERSEPVLATRRNVAPFRKSGHS